MVDSLDITVKDNRLFGVDQNGNGWRIGWCGNGQYSHWVVSPESDPEKGFYVYVFDKHSKLKPQIEAAEKKYGIYA